MIHPATELRFMGEHIGYGVVATKTIPKGTITWVRDPLDQEIPASRIQTLGPLFRETVDKYTWVDANGSYVLCWDLMRFVNHSCDAACLPAGPFDFTIAVRDIAPGEELTDDYATLNLDESFACACGSSRCRKEVGARDPAFMTDTWDQIVRAALPYVGGVTQPLWSLLSQREREGLERQLREPAKLPSIATQLRQPIGTHLRAV
jgi:hypothetical protein